MMSHRQQKLRRLHLGRSATEHRRHRSSTLQDVSIWSFVPYERIFEASLRMSAETEHDRIDAEIIKVIKSNDPFAAAVRATRMPMLIVFAASSTV